MLVSGTVSSPSSGRTFETIVSENLVRGDDQNIFEVISLLACKVNKRYDVGNGCFP